jgi:hypothetical protein
MLIDQHRRGKSDRLHAVGDLADLFLRMRARIARMRFDVVKRDRADRTYVGRRGQRFHGWQDVRRRCAVFG